MEEEDQKKIKKIIPDLKAIKNNCREGCDRNKTRKFIRR